jgi:GNAT superfamily N-acetyltransferase
MQTFETFLTESKIDKFENDSFIELKLYDHGARIGKAIILKKADSKGFWLSEIYIDSQFRGEGYAKKLMYAVLKIQKQSNVPMYLRAYSTEPNAKTDAELIRMYQSFGFQQVPNSPIGVMVLNHKK